MKKVLIFFAVLIVIGVVARWIFVLKYGKEIMAQAEKQTEERKKERDAILHFKPRVSSGEPQNTGYVPPLLSDLRKKPIVSPVIKLKNI